MFTCIQAPSFPGIYRFQRRGFAIRCWVHVAWHPSCQVPAFPRSPVSLVTCVCATFLRAEASKMAACDRGVTSPLFPCSPVYMAPCAHRDEVASKRSSTSTQSHARRPPCIQGARYLGFPGYMQTNLSTRSSARCRIHCIHAPLTWSPVPPSPCSPVSRSNPTDPQRPTHPSTHVSLFACLHLANRQYRRLCLISRPSATHFRLLEFAHITRTMHRSPVHMSPWLHVF